MSRMPWFCWPTGLAQDPVLGLLAQRADVLPPVAIAFWLLVLEHASDADERGDVTELNVELIAYVLRVDPEIVAKLIRHAGELGLLTDGRIARWERHLPRRIDPSAADRQRRFREARAVPTSRNVTGNVSNASRGDGEGDLEEKEISNGMDTVAGVIRENRPEALKIVAGARPSADPAIVIEKFIEFVGTGSPRGWRKGLASFARREFLEDAAISADGLATGLARQPGESADAYRARCQAATRPAPAVEERLRAVTAGLRVAR